MAGSGAGAAPPTLRFQVRSQESPGPLRVVGDWAALGVWEPGRGLPLAWHSDNCSWCSEPVQAEHARVSFKVVREVEGKVQWQGGGNISVNLETVPEEDGVKWVTVAWEAGVQGDELTLADEHLEAHAEALRGRYELYQQLCNRISGEWGGWDAMTSGFTHFGIQPCTVQAGCLPPGGSVPVPELTTGQVYREWAPCAKAVSLVGDFNAWDPHAHPCTVDAFGTWTAWLPPRPDGTPLVPHLAYMKAAVVLASSSAVPSQGDAGAGDGGAPPTPPSVHFAPSAFVHRMPAWARYAELDKAASAYCARHWNPAQSYSWQHARPLQEALRTGGVEALSDVTGVGAGHRPAHVHVSLPAHCAAPAPSTAAAARLKLLKHTQPPKHIETALQAGADTASRAAAEAFTQGWGSTAGEAAPVDVRHSAGSLRVYECHVGLCCEDERVGSYAEFTANVLPRIAAGGYTAIQLMGVMEHAYYASFGYHVTSFHAVASRSGTPDDFKALVDTAHGLGLSVIIDCVHSHASKNTEDGLNNWDGSGHQYFHEGPRGMHAQWDSRLFNYEQPEVLRFLLSNLRWWLQEYNVDGFRFDGVTSMMYTHHGIGVGFSGDYAEYFGPHADTAAQAYLMLANTLCKALVEPDGTAHPTITIAEDVSGMPGLCRPVWEGGLGFDARLAMAIPDMWIKLLKEVPDPQWDMGHIVHTLTNRRWGERTLAYAESHDQALVGDKTLAMWLLDAEIYDGMTVLAPLTPRVSRGIALHKLIRTITLVLGGEGYLAFAGNTFGHPEWLDFPREGNGWSFAHCRRQWSLVDDPLLRYSHLEAWDRALMHTCAEHPLLSAQTPSWISVKHEDDKVIVAERGLGATALVFAFNWHPTKSFPDYPVPVPAGGCWRVALSSDDPCMGGHGNAPSGTQHHALGSPLHERADHVKVYLPSRTVIVLQSVPAEA